RRGQPAARAAQGFGDAGSQAAQGRSRGQVAAPRAPGRAPFARVARQGEAAVSRLAIFDCDGTLVDSGATIHAALRETFGQHALEIPEPKASRWVIGLSLIEAMAALVPAASAQQHYRLAEDYKLAFQKLRAAGQVEEPLFDGVLELL